MTSDPGVCEICGKELAGDHAECRKREAEWHAERRRQDDQLVAQFKLKSVTDENRDAFHRAVQAVSRAVDQAGIAVDESGACRG